MFVINRGNVTLLCLILQLYYYIHVSLFVRSSVTFLFKAVLDNHSLVKHVRSHITAVTFLLSQVQKLLKYVSDVKE